MFSFTLATTSRNQDGGAGGAAAFEIAVSLGGVCEGIFLVDRDLDGAALSHFEQMVGDGEQVGALGVVSVQRRTGRKQRALLLQDIDVEGFDLPRGAAEADEHAERRQTVERRRERRLADA